MPFAGIVKGVAVNSAVSRLIFRSAVTLVVQDVDEATAPHFNSSLKILTEHAQVWAWYYAMFQALQANDKPWILALWQAGLCVTLHVRVGRSLVDQAILSIQLSDSRKQVARSSDTFPTFAAKALVILKLSPDAPRGLKKPISICKRKAFDSMAHA